MTLIQMNYDSRTIEQKITTTISVPERITQQTRVLWLLHGWSGDDTDWTSNSCLTQIIADKNIVVIMPNGYNSYYSDGVQGPAFYSAFVDELFPYLQQLFHLPTIKNNNFIAGLSMGGYGAFKIALREPQKYAGAISLSGALDINAAYQSDWERKTDFERIFGSQATFHESDNDLLKLVQQKKVTELKLLMYAGRDDFLLSESQHFYAVAERFLPVEFHIEPGAHNWTFWAAHIADVIKWISEFDHVESAR